MQSTQSNPQSGNVLFLILIAVALFAALSFAIGQSMRSSGGTGAAEETSRVNGAYLHQFPTSIRQAILRMEVSKSLTVEDISFAHPGTTDYGTFGTTPEQEVFHPLGGATPYQLPPANLNDGSEWIFNGDLEVKDLGRTNGDSSSTELMALLPGVKLEVCKYLNYGVSNSLQTPPSLTLTGETNKFTGTFGYASTITDAVLDGKDAYCYYSTALGKYVYYQVLEQR